MNVRVLGSNPSGITTPPTPLIITEHKFNQFVQAPGSNFIILILQIFQKDRTNQKLLSNLKLWL
jgi:hypothetical protein